MFQDAEEADFHLVRKVVLFGSRHWNKAWTMIPSLWERYKYLSFTLTLLLAICFLSVELISWTPDCFFPDSVNDTFIMKPFKICIISLFHCMAAYTRSAQAYCMIIPGVDIQFTGLGKSAVAHTTFVCESNRLVNQPDYIFDLGSLPGGRFHLNIHVPAISISNPPFSNHKSNRNWNS